MKILLADGVVAGALLVVASAQAQTRGNLFFIDFTDPQYSDVSQNIQNLDVEVYEGGFVGVPERLIGTAGINILGKTPDCASGGAGCP